MPKTYGPWKSFEATPVAPDQDWVNRAYGDPCGAEAQYWHEQFRQLSGPVLVKWWDGSSFVLWPGEQLSRAIAQTGSYEPGTAAALRWALRTGDVFLDVGANDGVFTAAATQWVGAAGRVIAVEPSGRELSKLAYLLEAHANQGFEIVPAALGERTGHGRISIASDFSAGLNTLARRFGKSDQAPGWIEEIDVVALDDLAEDWPRLDVIKADIEGAELDMLKGGTRTLKRFKPLIVLEVGGEVMGVYGATEHELAKCLASFGYTLFEPGTSSAAPTPLACLGTRQSEMIVAIHPEWLTRRGL